MSKLMFVCVVGWWSFVRSFVHSFIRHLFVRSFVRSSCVGRSVGGRSLIPPNSVLPLLSFVHRLSFVRTVTRWLVGWSVGRSAGLVVCWSPLNHLSSSAPAPSTAVPLGQSLSTGRTHSHNTTPTRRTLSLVFEPSPPIAPCTVQNEHFDTLPTTNRN